VIITRHARERMAERKVDDELLLRLVDTGLTRYSDETHLAPGWKSQVEATTWYAQCWFWRTR
jgi:hypothetical protein